MRLALTVNGKQQTAEVEPRLLLVEFLREHLRLTVGHQIEGLVQRLGSVVVEGGRLHG